MNKNKKKKLEKAKQIRSRCRELGVKEAVWVKVAIDGPFNKKGK